eukprot:m.965123 g.965123  ORF g.965123 m.965123 type:complete len:69 (-) comp23908_c0_seq1:397-603(-)
MKERCSRNVTRALQVGFAPDSHVAVYDVLAHGVFGGWYHGGYTTATPVPPHGTVLLRLSFVADVDARV